MTHYLPFDVTPSPSREQRAQYLRERLAAARIAVVTAQSEQRLLELEYEIDKIAAELADEGI